MDTIRDERCYRFFVCQQGFVDVLSNELKNVLQKLFKDITIKMYALVMNTLTILLENMRDVIRAKEYDNVYRY